MHRIKTIKYRPFLVKEEKLLVLAMKVKTLNKSLQRQECNQELCLDKGYQSWVTPSFDIEYLFLNIRGKSVGEEVEVNITA